MIDLLLRYGAKPNLPDTSGHKPVHTAARAGRVEILESLVHHGVNLEDTVSIAFFLRSSVYEFRYFWFLFD